MLGDHRGRVLDGLKRFLDGIQAGQHRRVARNLVLGFGDLFLNQVFLRLDFRRGQVLSQTFGVNARAGPQGGQKVGGRSAHGV